MKDQRQKPTENERSEGREKSLPSQYRELLGLREEVREAELRYLQRLRKPRRRPRETNAVSSTAADGSKDQR